MPATIARTLSGEHLHLFTESIPHLVWVAGPDGRLEYLNRRCLDYVGLPMADLLGWDWGQAIHPDDMGRTTDRWARALDTGEEFAAEYRLRRHDGVFRWHLGRALPDRGPDGAVRRWVGTCTDVDEQKQAEDRAAAGEARFRAVIERSFDAVAVLDAGGAVRYATGSVRAVLGYDPAEFVGRSAFDFAHPDDLPEHAGRMRHLLDGPGAWVAACNRYRHADGGWRWLETRATSLLTDPAVRGIVVNFRDVTDQRAAQEALRANEARFRALVENSHDAVELLAADGTILYATPSIVRTGGRTPDEIVGRNALEWAHPDDLAGLGEQLGTFARESGTAVTGEYRYRHRDGTWRWAEATVTNLLHDPAVGAVVANIHDVTDRKEATDALRRTTDLLTAVTDGTTDAVFVKDPEGKYLFANPAALRTLGRPAAEVLGRDDAALLDPASAARLMDRDRRVMAAGEPGTEEEVLTVGGEPRTFLATKAPYRTADGRVAGLVGVSRDITDRARGEAEVRAWKARYEAAVRATGQVLYDWDTATDRLEWGGNCEGTLGYAAGEMPADVAAYLDLVHPDDRPAVAAEVARVLATGDSFRLEYRVRRSDGAYVVVAEHGRFLPAAGGRARMVGFLSDVTDRRRAEEEREKFVALVEHSADFVGMADLDGRVFYLNPAGRRLVGLDPGRPARDTRIEDYVPADVAEFYREVVIPQVLAGGRWEGETRFKHLVTGRPLDVQQCVFAVRSPVGDPVCMATVVRDVTERKQLEEQLRQAQKMEAVGRLAGGIAHDFNNLLTVINGFSDIVLTALHPHDPARPMLEEVKKAGERAAGLTRQLLAFSRRQILQRKVLDLNGVVADLGRMLQRVIGEDVELALSPGPGLLRVEADPGQVEQLLMNLAVNARDAMPTGGRLTVETANVILDRGLAPDGAEVRPGPYVRLAVADTGCGMDDEVQAHLFEPFFTTKELGKGTGLGLATVYGIVKQSGGHIEVETAPGRGATFRVYFPAVSGGAPAAEVVEDGDDLPRGTETVLVVEDEAGVRGLTRLVLQRLGYTVLEASDGEQAVARARGSGRAVDLLLTDVVMPGEGGRAVAERLQREQPGVRVLFMSGYTNDEVVRHGVLEEHVDFLQKPFTPAALAAKVRDALDRAD